MTTTLTTIIMKKNFYIISVIMLCSFNGVVAQSSAEKRAAKLYDNLAYEAASRSYSKLADKNNATDESIRRAAYTNYRLHKTAKAEMYYKKLVDGNKANAEDVFNYAQCLKANNKYGEAEQALNNYSNMAKGQVRATEINNKTITVAKIQAQKPYFELNKISGNSKKADFSPYYLNDNTVLFASNRKGSLASKNIHTYNEENFLDLYQATPDASGNLTEVKKYTKTLNTRFHEGTICLNKAGDVMFFTRNNYANAVVTKSDQGVNNLQLFKAKKVGSAWVEEKLPFNDKSYSCGHPTLSPDETILFFVSDMPNGVGGTDIYQLKINTDGSANGSPENLGNKINTEGNEMFPMVSGNTMYFSSNGHVGLGQLDVYATSIDIKGKLGTITNLGAPINTGADDFGLVLNKDNKGYISSNREEGMGDDDIYFVKMIAPLKPVYKLKGIAKNPATGKPVEGATVALTDQQGSKIGEVTTGPNGDYSFDVDPSMPYVLKGSKTKYLPGMNQFNTNELSPEKPELVKDVDLSPDEGFSLYGLVTDKKEKNPLENVKVKLVEVATGKTIVQTNTPNTGDFNKVLDGARLNDQLDYMLSLEKDGYLTKNVPYKKILDKPGVYKLHEEMDLGMDKIAVGMDIAKIIQINPIYFDFAKWNIRKDAAIELEKIVQVMKDNPAMVIELGSHTDCRSSIKSNMNLSDARAKASAAYIISKGVSKERIYGKGYGESRLVNACACEGTDKTDCTEEQHQLNRRTEFVIVKM
jgi:outer membrane protein OmpA-like peptidoglycan-associated protein